MEQGRGEEIKGLQLQVQAQQEDQRGGGGGIIRQNPKQHHHPHQPPPAQPQKCPRCDSSNTKFCYYNNYSLSQPRYFCKTCRRYWTQGGTLRNVPVGGGCRKGKRLMKKPSSSSSGDNHNNNNNNNNHSSSHQPNQMISSATSGMGKQNDTISAPFQTFNFPGGGFLSSYGGIQNFSGDVGGSNLGLLQGFAHPSFLLHHQPQQHQEQEEQPQNLQFHQIPTTHVFNMGSSREILEENAIQHTKPSTSRHHHQDWSQSFNNTSTNTSPIMMNSEAGYWSNNTTNTSTTSNTKTNTINNSTSGGGGSLNLNQTHPWVDLPGFGAPLPSTTSSSSSPSFL